MRKLMRAIMVTANDRENLCGLPDRETWRQRDIDMDRRNYKLNWTPMGFFGPQYGDKCIATLDSHTGN